jgi:hypothetical protein
MVNPNSDKLILTVRETLANVEGSLVDSDWNEMEKILNARPKKYNVLRIDFSSYILVGSLGIVIVGILIFMLFNNSGSLQPEQNEASSLVPDTVSVIRADTTASIKKDSAIVNPSVSTLPRIDTIQEKHSLTGETQPVRITDEDTLKKKTPKKKKVIKTDSLSNIKNDSSLPIIPPDTTSRISSTPTITVKDSTQYSKPKKKKTKKSRSADPDSLDQLKETKAGTDSTRK